MYDFLNYLFKNLIISAMLSTLARTSGRLVARRSYGSATLDAHSQASSFFLMTPFEKCTTLENVFFFLKVHP